jgi:subtilisin family serine protease
MTLGLALTSLASVAMAAHISPDLKAHMRSGTETKILVYFQDESPQLKASESQEQVLRRLQANLQRTRHILEGEMGFSARDRIRSLNWITNSASMEADAETIREIARHPAVTQILWDAPVEAPHTIEATTQRPEEGAYTYGLKNLGVDKVREVFGLTGAGVRIGVIDTGADGNHPDLKGRITLYKDLSGETTFPTDTQGHGTHTAGTLVGGNASGTQIGVAPDAELLVARGIAGSSSLTNLLKAMEWMLDPDGDPATADAPVVVSMSWHSGSGDQEPFYRALAAMEAAGVIANFSAGNSGTRGLTHPKEYPYTFTTAATDSGDGIASFSSRGPATYKGTTQQKPEWAAPGVDIYSAKPGGGYTKMSGTSMACPHGAGVIALLFQANPDLTPTQVREVLTTTAKDLGPVGWDKAFGAGRLDAFAAVQMVATGGKILGKVTDSAGAPIAYAKVKVLERGYSLAVKPDGSFKMLLPEGTYTLEVHAFGFVATSQQVTVASDSEITLDLILEAAPLHEVSGTILSTTGTPVVAKVRAVGTPIEPIPSDANGNFALQLPAGEYNLQVAAFGFEVATQSVNVPGGNVAFELSPLPPILVIDDDNGKNYQDYFTKALDTLGEDYGVLKMTEGELDAETLTPYKTVIWLTGDVSSKPISAQEQGFLKEYLARGGHLFLSGQDLGYGLKSDPFYKNVLKAKYVKDTAGVHQVRGLGLDFSLKGGDGADNQKYPDVIKALDGAELVFQYSENKGGAGLKVGENLVYLGFGLEGINSAEGRAALMGKVLGALEGASKLDTTSKARRGLVRQDQFQELFD